MLVAGNGVAVPYVGCFAIASGIFTASGIAVVWMPSNLPRYGKRSTAVGMQLMIGTSAGIAAPYVSIYPHTSLRFIANAKTFDSCIPRVIHHGM